MPFRTGELWYNLWPMKVCFETFGCRLNRAEALDQEAEYLAAGWELTDSHSDADVIVVRGCSVTRRAQRECEHLIAHIRKKYPLKRLLIEGCLAVGRTASFKQNDLAVAFILYVGHVGGFCTRVPFALCLSGVGEGIDVVEPTVEA